MNYEIIHFYGILSAPEYWMRNMNYIPILYQPDQYIGISALAVNEYIKTFVYFPAPGKESGLQLGIPLDQFVKALADRAAADIYLLYVTGKRL